MVETYGALGKEARAFIADLALMASREDPGLSSSEARREFLGEVSVANQRGNAATILAGLAWSARRN